MFHFRISLIVVSHRLNGILFISPVGGGGVSASSIMRATRRFSTSSILYLDCTTDTLQASETSQHESARELQLVDKEVKKKEESGAATNRKEGESRGSVKRKKRMR